MPSSEIEASVSPARRTAAAAGLSCLRLVVGTLLGLLVAVLLIGAFSTWYGAAKQPFRILVGDSMLPTLASFDVVTTKPVDAVERGDIVSWRGMMHRIVALPGETVFVRKGTVVIRKEHDSATLVEPYVVYQYAWDLEPVALGPDEYLYLGDNRTVAASRGPWIANRAELERKLDRIMWPPWLATPTTRPRLAPG